MTTDTLRRLQALRGLTRPGPGHAVIAQLQGDLQTVIEAVLELAGHDDETTDEPAIGEQVTDSDGDVWQRFEDGWSWWARDGWSPYLRTWDGVQTSAGPLRPTTNDDRRPVGLPVRDENTPPASQNGPQGARSADSGTGGPPEPENAVQGRIGWLRLRRGSTLRLLAREVEGGWTQDGTDLCDWSAESYPDAVFTPIRTLADDEVAVKRDDLREVALDGVDAVECCASGRCEVCSPGFVWGRDG